VEVSVLEVGLGGRLDATNVVAPTVTAITTIGHDHMQYLGATLPEVAAEKAGIIKPGVPVVVGSIPPDAAAVIARIAEAQRAPVVSSVVGCTVVDEGATPEGGRRMRLRTPLRDYGTLDLALAGAHQVDNAVVAVRMLETLDGAGVRVPADAIRRGLAVVAWPGRLDRRRLSDGREVLFDAAHNPEGAQALAAFLASEPGGPSALVFTAMRDKDVTDMLRALMPQVRALVLTRALTPRSADPIDLARVARALDIPTVVLVEPSIAEALDAAWDITRRIVVAGSIFLLGDVMKHLGWS
jgi:dihydrofolate synthase/folylpolyglutamate synthase